MAVILLFAAIVALGIAWTEQRHAAHATEMARLAVSRRPAPAVRSIGASAVGQPQATSTLASPQGPYRAGSVLVGFRSGVLAGKRSVVERSVGALGAKRLGPAIKPVGHGRVTGAEYLAPFELRVPDTQVLSVVDKLRHNS